MRALRWKNRFSTGDAEVDRRNRAFIDCVNKLIEAADQREHCGEMTDFIGLFTAEAERILLEHPTDDDLKQAFGRRLLEALPLDPYGANACRKCGLCDLAQEQIAEHLEAPVECLFEGSGI